MGAFGLQYLEWPLGKNVLATNISSQTVEIWS